MFYWLGNTAIPKQQKLDRISQHPQFINAARGMQDYASHTLRLPSASVISRALQSAESDGRLILTHVKVDAEVSSAVLTAVYDPQPARASTQLPVWPKLETRQPTCRAQ